ncbi:hypothetical protein ABIB35_002030 [Arthrobacter sp. UYP6]|uniref:hypothetical protein n=1 Tax=Arthrobacter sp. UYP6 TaxID=1756378 RepID=UPI00339A42B0
MSESSGLASPSASAAAGLNAAVLVSNGSQLLLEDATLDASGTGAAGVDGASVKSVFNLVTGRRSEAFGRLRNTGECHRERRGRGQISNITGNGFHLTCDASAAAYAYLAGDRYSLIGGGDLTPEQ